MSTAVPHWRQDPEFQAFAAERARERAELVEVLKQRTYTLLRDYESNTMHRPAGSPSSAGQHCRLLLHHDAWIALLADPAAVNAGIVDGGYGEQPTRRFFGLEVLQTLDIAKDEVMLVLGEAHPALRHHEVQP